MAASKGKTRERATETADAKDTHGSIKVMVKRTNEEGVETREPLDVHQFQTEAARVEVHHGCTQQIAEYDYLRVDVTVSMPCYREEVSQTLDEVSNMVYTRLDTEVAAAMGETEEPIQEEVKPEKATKGKGKAKAKESETEEEEEADPLTYDELAEMSDDDLIDVAKENKIKLTAKDKKDSDLLFTKVLEGLGIEDEGEEGAEDEGGEEEESEYDYETVAAMDDDELMDLAKELKVKLSAKDKKDMDIVFDKVCDELGLEDGEEAEEEADDEDEDEGITAEDVEAMSLKELLAFVDELAEDEDDPVEISVTARTAKNQKALAKQIIEELGL